MLLWLVTERRAPFFSPIRAVDLGVTAILENVDVAFKMAALVVAA